MLRKHSLADGLRREILKGRQGKERILELAEMIVDYLLGRHLSEDKGPDEWDVPALELDLKEYYGLESGAVELPGKTREDIREALLTELHRRYESKPRSGGSRPWRKPPD